MRRTSHIAQVKILFALVLASIFFSSLAQRYLGNILAGPNIDFYDYYFAGQIMHHDRHANLYAGATDGNPQLRSAPEDSEMTRRARAAGFSDMELYLYPPLLADLLSPLSVLPPHLAATLWRVFNLGLIFATALLLARMLGLPWLSFPFAALVAAAFAFWPIHEAISLGQISIVLLALWTAGIFAYLRGYLALSAAAFALCSVLKVTPILIVPLFLIWKERQWLIYYAGVLLALLAGMAAFNGVANLRASFHVLVAMGGSVPALQNKCFGALLAWIHYGRLPSLNEVQPLLNAPPHGLLLLTKPLGLAFYALCLFLAWRRRSDQDRLNRATVIAIFALVLAAMSPVSWRHGYTAALIPLAMLWDQALRASTSILRTILLALASFTIGSLCFDLAAQLHLPQPLKILCAATWLVFTVALCVEVLWQPAATDSPDEASNESASPQRLTTSGLQPRS